MKIINLIENTEGDRGCAAAHGLSFYIETAHHTLLMDLGPSDETLRNAEKLGIDLGRVDTVVLSHGHYDHSGGILAFAARNPRAAIYLQRTATGDYYSDTGRTDVPEEERYRYIGIDKRIAELPGVVFLDGDCRIDDELSLFTLRERTVPVPSTNSRMKERTNGRYDRDDFRHEQYLVIAEGERRILLSGCAHNGMVNILAEYRRRCGADPDAAISGFHLMKKTDYTECELREIDETAEALLGFDTVFYTGHCTGLPAFLRMKETMGGRLRYVHSGDPVKLDAGGSGNGRSGAVRKELFRLSDRKYRAFQRKLIPTVDPGTVIGVRLPDLRQYAKQLRKDGDDAAFLADLPHRYYDENMLHACLLSEENDADRCVAELERFLPYTDNWATCDTILPKAFRKRPAALLPMIRRWIASGETYTVRFGIGTLMRHYLDDAFDPAYPELVASVRSDEYYVNMMIAWYFATALAKQYDAVLPFLSDRRLAPWTHNKTIQKAVESDRVPNERKRYLKSLRIGSDGKETKRDEKR